MPTLRFGLDVKHRREERIFVDRILEKSTVFVPGGTVIKVFSFDPERCTMLMYVSTEANLLSKIRIA